METQLCRLNFGEDFTSPTRLEGMETRHLASRSCSGSESPTRLEGMETEQGLNQLSSRIGLRPALRGWKLILTSLVKRGEGMSPTRLEGMETQ